MHGRLASDHVSSDMTINAAFNFFFFYKGLLVLKKPPRIKKKIPTLQVHLASFSLLFCFVFLAHLQLIGLDLTALVNQLPSNQADRKVSN